MNLLAGTALSAALSLTLLATASSLVPHQPFPPEILELRAHLASQADSVEAQLDAPNETNMGGFVPGAFTPESGEPWRATVRLWFETQDVDRGVAVIGCESAGIWWNTNPNSGAAGLFQHLPKYWSSRSKQAGYEGAGIYEVTANVAVAAWLVYHGGGWGHWEPSEHCWENG